jgi:AAA+ ATPase superfamily predicted ATPase
VGILRSIAHGARTQKEISVRTGLAQGHVSKYLSVLREAGFVERRVPVTASASSRQGRYHITDPYLRFYYRFLATRQAQLALGIQEQALAEIQRHLLDFIGTHTWEELCREWVLRASACGELPFLADQVGSLWNRNAQIDVAGINTMERTLILGECKWSPKRQGQSVLRELVAKTASAIPKQGSWRVVFLGFARGGWTSTAHQFAQGLQHAGMRESTWAVEKVELLDLDRVDGDLTRWSAL